MRDEHYRKLERMYAAAPTNQYYQPRLSIEEGKATVQIPLRDAFHHSAGAVHGSVYFKALDDAAFFAANSIVSDVFVLTATFEIKLRRPVMHGTITAIATVTHEDDRRIYASAELLNDDGTIIATGTGEFARSSVALTPEVHYK